MTDEKKYCICGNLEGTAVDDCERCRLVAEIERLRNELRELGRRYVESWNATAEAIEERDEARNETMQIEPEEIRNADIIDRLQWHMDTCRYDYPVMGDAIREIEQLRECNKNANAWEEGYKCGVETRSAQIENMRARLAAVSTSEWYRITAERDEYKAELDEARELARRYALIIDDMYYAQYPWFRKKVSDGK